MYVFVDVSTHGISKTSFQSFRYSFTNTNFPNNVFRDGQRTAGGHLHTFCVGGRKAASIIEDCPTENTVKFFAKLYSNGF